MAVLIVENILNSILFSPLVAPGLIEATFSVLNDNSARVTWQPPSPPNGVITQYNIVVYNTRSNYRRTFTKRGDDTDLSVTLNDLGE